MLLVLAAIRAAPGPIGSAFKVRTRAFDILTILLLSGSIAVLTFWVPGSQ